jgi:hypothetical protein
MKVIDWNLYWMQRQAQRNSCALMPLRGAVPVARSSLHASDRIRMDCLQRYVKAQLLPRSTK